MKDPSPHQRIFKYFEVLFLKEQRLSGKYPYTYTNLLRGELTIVILKVTRRQSLKVYTHHPFSLVNFLHHLLVLCLSLLAPLQHPPCPARSAFFHSFLSSDSASADPDAKVDHAVLSVPPVSFVSLPLPRRRDPADKDLVIFNSRLIVNLLSLTFFLRSVYQLHYYAARRAPEFTGPSEGALDFLLKERDWLTQLPAIEFLFLHSQTLFAFSFQFPFS